jgi:hypothetical protein
MSGVQVVNLIVGVGLILGAAYLVRDLRASALVIHRYYHGRKPINWGPERWRRQFRPTEGQATLLAVLLIGVMLFFGVCFVLYSFGVVTE